MSCASASSPGFPRIEPVDGDDRVGPEDDVVRPGGGHAPGLQAGEAKDVGLGRFGVERRLVHVSRHHVEGQAGGAQQVGAAG